MGAQQMETNAIERHHDHSEDLRGHEPATFGQRFLAALLDGLILGVVTAGLDYFGKIVSGLVPAHLGAAVLGGMAAVSFFLSFFLYAHLLSFYGFTPGKRIMKLRVISIDNGGNLTFWKAFVREIPGKAISGILLLVGYLMAAFRADKRALHDLMAKSQVVKV